jgi:hypothetical protein
MYRNLHHILPGVGVRRSEISHYRLIQHIAVGNVDQRAEARPACSHLMSQPQQGRNNLPRLRAREPHHANPAAPRRRRDGYNRLLLKSHF